MNSCKIRKVGKFLYRDENIFEVQFRENVCKNFGE